MPARPSRAGPAWAQTGPAKVRGALRRANEARERRKERLEKIKELFRKAIAYDTVVAKARDRGDVPPAPDARLEALAPYARGQKPVILHAEQQVEILDALDIIRELKLKGVISGGSEAWKVADALKQAKVPVLVGGTLKLPRHDYDPYDAEYANPAKLHAAGVTVAIHSKAGAATNETAARNLPFEAATAVAFGLPEEVALKAVTLTPAQILGVADQVGSLEVGKRANLVVTAGHLLQPTTPVLALFIDGEPLRPESRHTRLYAKYRHRLDEVRAGRARLGIEQVPHQLHRHRRVHFPNYPARKSVIFSFPRSRVGMSSSTLRVGGRWRRGWEIAGTPSVQKVGSHAGAWEPDEGLVLVPTLPRGNVLLDAPRWREVAPRLGNRRDAERPESGFRRGSVGTFVP